MNAFFEISNGFKIKITVFDNLEEFHKAIGFPDAPDWVVGSAISLNKGIFLVNPGKLENMNNEEYQKIVIHEYIHILEMKKIGNIEKKPIWINEGLAVYLSNQINGEINKKQAYDITNKLNVNIIEYLSSNPNQFGEKQGYLLSRYLVEYSISKFGKANFIELYRKSGNIEKVFKIPIQDFENGFMDFLSS